MKTSKMTNLDMKRAYINNVPLRHGEVTIITSDNAMATMQHSSRLAESIKNAGSPTLLINCGMSDKRFKEYFYENHDAAVKNHEIVLYSSIRGDLIGEREAIDQIVVEAGIGVVIIAGWEWTSSSWRRRQRLLFYLRELMEDRDVAIIIYSHTANAPVAGEIDHGGVGKLALLAMFVIELNTVEELEKQVPIAPSVCYRTYEEYLEAERSAQVMLSKINGLQGEEGELRITN